MEILCVVSASMSAAPLPTSSSSRATGTLLSAKFCRRAAIDVALGFVDRSLALNLSFARGWFMSGLLRLFAGQPDVALEHFDTFLRLSPRDRLAFYWTSVGNALFFNRRFDDAVPKLLASLEQVPTFALTYRLLAACYAHMDRLDDARGVIDRLRAMTPVVVPNALPYRNSEHRELFLSGLRLAAGEAM